MTTPLLAPEEAQPSSSVLDVPLEEPPASSEELARPFRLGVVGVGAALGLFGRLAIANGYGELDSRLAMLVVAAASLLMGLGLVLIAAERDRFGPALWWISSVTAFAWGALNWISPPFNKSVTVWSKPDQSILALVGIGSGLLLAGLIALAFVRRRPTFSVAATMVSALAALTANTLLLHIEWPAIFAMGVAFALILLAWDRSPRREATFAVPSHPPRISRAALSFVAVALCGTAIQLWLSRNPIPRGVPALIIAIVLVGAAFVSLVRVRREIQRRETTLSEWTSWMREIRTNDFRAEMQNFESPAPPVTFDPRPPVGSDGEAPRKLSFPNLSIPDEDDAESIEPLSPDHDVPEAGPAPASEAGTPELPRIEIPVAGPESESDDIKAAELAETPESVAASTATVAPGLASSTLPVADRPPEAAQQVPQIILPTADPTPTAKPAAPEPVAAPEPATQEPVATTGPATPEPVPVAVTPEPVGSARPGAFSNILATADEPSAQSDRVSDLAALGAWLEDPTAPARDKPLLVAIEAMSLDEFESMSNEDQSMARDEIGSFLADTMPDADLVSWIDGPYFIVAHASKTDAELMALNKLARRTLRSTRGTLAFLRPSGSETLDDIVNEAVIGLLQARQLEARATD